MNRNRFTLALNEGRLIYITIWKLLNNKREIIFSKVIGLTQPPLACLGKAYYDILLMKMSK